MNLQVAAFTVLLALAASAQARSPTPAQAQLPAPGVTRHVAVPALAARALAFPAATFAIDAKKAIALPPSFAQSTPDPMASPPPPQPRVEWSGPILGTKPGTHQPPVVGEPATEVPPPHCGARPC